MATIRGQTERPVRVLPALTGGQALGLLATAAASWLVWTTGAPSWMRVAAIVGVVLGGGAYVLGRWPPGPDGERVALWAPRLVGYLVAPRSRAGADVPGWDGLLSVDGDQLCYARMRALVLECGGQGCGLRGSAAAGAAEVVFREFVDAIDTPVQIVRTTRYIRTEDRPSAWGDGGGRPAMARLSTAYADYWATLVGSRRAVIRRCFLVVTAPGEEGPSSATLVKTREAYFRLTTRLGLVARPVTGTNLINALREGAGATPLNRPLPSQSWAVGGGADG